MAKVDLSSLEWCDLIFRIRRTAPIRCVKTLRAATT